MCLVFAFLIRKQTYRQGLRYRQKVKQEKGLMKVDAGRGGGGGGGGEEWWGERLSEKA